MKTTQERLKGVVVPAITPVDKNDKVDTKAFRAVLNRLIKAGVHGIFVGGSAGEGPLLADREWRRMIETAPEVVGDKIPLLGGAIDTSSARICDKAKTLRGTGYRVYAVVTPSYYIAVKTASEHLRLFGAAREALGDVEMVAYNIPGCTASTIAVDTFCEMARRGWIRHCKESSGDLPYLLELIRRGADMGLGVPALLVAAQEPNEIPRVREHALRVAIRLDSAKTPDTIAVMAKDLNPSVRKAAAFEARYVREKAVIPTLIPMVTDEERFEAMSALHSLWILTRHETEFHDWDTSTRQDRQAWVSAWVEWWDANKEIFEIPEPRRSGQKSQG